MVSNQLKQSSTFIATIALLSLIFAVLISIPATRTAYADDSLDELNEKITETTNAYDEASEQVETLTQSIADNQAKITELEGSIGSAKEESLEAAKQLYKYKRSTPSLLTLVFSSSDPAQLFKNIEYLTHYQDGLYDKITAATRMQEELEATNEELAEEKEQAEQAQQEAAEALEEAKAARKAAMEKAAAQAAKEAEEEKKAQESEGKAESGGSSVNSDEVDWNVSKSEFISEWTPRIDSYLKGSPLAGQGKTFATAAWNYGVDPRWSPAISCVESGKGANCFKSHNAWGWGSKSWSNWEDAIDSHVSGLARIYGSTITYSAAKKYCPPNYEHWYNTCISEMRKI